MRKENTKMSELTYTKANFYDKATAEEIKAAYDYWKFL